MSKVTAKRETTFTVELTQEEADALYGLLHAGTGATTLQNIGLDGLRDQLARAGATGEKFCYPTVYFGSLASANKNQQNYRTGY